MIRKSVSYQYYCEAGSRARHLLLFLHGARQIAGNTRQQTTKHGPWQRSNARVAAELRDFVRVAPHIKQKEGVWDANALSRVVGRVPRRHPRVIRNALGIIGISRGGWGALDFVANCEEEIAVLGAIVFCPERTDNLPRALKRAPVLLFHAEDDRIVSQSRSRQRYRDLTVRPNFQWVNVHRDWTIGENHHNCWTHVIGSPEIYRWLRSLRDDVDYGNSKRRWPNFSRFERPRPRR